jgi:hypothetical protein
MHDRARASVCGGGGALVCSMISAAMVGDVAARHAGRSGWPAGRDRRTSRLARACAAAAGSFARNLALHDRVHEAFARRAVGEEVEAFVAWIYRELFLMPPEDPALGLDAPDPFSAVV